MSPRLRERVPYLGRHNDHGLLLPLAVLPDDRSALRVKDRPAQAHLPVREEWHVPPVLPAEPRGVHVERAELVAADIPAVDDGVGRQADDVERPLLARPSVRVLDSLADERLVERDVDVLLLSHFFSFPMLSFAAVPFPPAAFRGSAPRCPSESPAQDVARPRSALHEREDQEHAHRKVLKRVGQPSDDGVDHRRADARRVEPAQYDGERDEEHEDDDPGEADGGEVLQVSDAHLPCLVERDEGERDGAERGHHVDLDGSRPADDERHHVGDDDHKPAHEGDDEHGDQRRDVVIRRGDGYRLEVELGSGPEKARHAVYRELDHLIDRLHEVEAVLNQEQEHGEEDEHEYDLLDTGHARVAVHALRHLNELDGEHEREHAAADGQDGRLPHAAHDVIHRHVARAPEHLREVRREHPVRADRPEHVGLPGEYPVAGVPQHPAQPCVDVLRDPRERRRREGEGCGAREDGKGEREREPAASDGLRDRLSHRRLLTEDGELTGTVDRGDDRRGVVVQMKRGADAPAGDVDENLPVEGGARGGGRVSCGPLGDRRRELVGSAVHQ